MRNEAQHYQYFIGFAYIDVLVVHNKFWILVIESKSTKFDVTIALPQALAYMLNSCDRETFTFALIVNGREFIFLKLVGEEIKYARSYELSIEKDDEFQQVLNVLKQVGELVINV